MTRDKLLSVHHPERHVGSHTITFKCDCNTSIFHSCYAVMALTINMFSLVGEVNSREKEGAGLEILLLVKA